MTRVLFIADQFAESHRTALERYPGGAELTDEAAIAACPWEIEVVRTNEVVPGHLEAFDLHIIGNFEAPSSQLVAELLRLRRHVFFEHDLRICRWRGNFPVATEYLHRHLHQCICPLPHLTALYATALGTIFLTEAQRRRYEANPFFGPQGRSNERTSVLGSSLMSQAFIDRVRDHQASRKPRDLDTVIVYSRQRAKGFEPALEYCRDRGIEPFVIENLKPAEVLDVFARARSLVYLPRGPEAAGRLVLEARFLGCEVITNDLVAVCHEPWWPLPDSEALDFVIDGPHRFWRLVEAHLAIGPPDLATPPRHRPPIARHFNLGLSIAERLAILGPVLAILGRDTMTGALAPRRTWPVD